MPKAHLKFTPAGGRRGMMDLAELAAKHGCAIEADQTIKAKCPLCGGRATLFEPRPGLVGASCGDCRRNLRNGDFARIIASLGQNGNGQVSIHRPFSPANENGSVPALAHLKDPLQAMASAKLELATLAKEWAMDGGFREIYPDNAEFAPKLLEQLRWAIGKRKLKAFEGLSESETDEELQEILDAYCPTVVDEPVIQLPDLTRKALEPLRWDQLQARRAIQMREWVVEGKLAKGETSSWSGKVEAGKTTLMRELTLCVLRGEPFLGCETHQGRVAYVMLDADGEDVTYDAFSEMGFNGEDGENALFLFEPMFAQIEKGFERLVGLLLDFKPSLVVIDPYPRLKMIEDFHSYTNTYLMGQISGVAKMVNANLALPGHIPRGRDDDAEVATAGFGSISFTGGVNARFIVTNRNGTHTIRSSKGKGSGFVPFDGEFELVQDPGYHRISLGGVWSWKDKAKGFQEKVFDFLESQPDRCFDTMALGRELRIQKSVLRAAANMLYGSQKIKRSGEGLKSQPFIFASINYHGEMTSEAVKSG